MQINVTTTARRAANDLQVYGAARRSLHTRVLNTHAFDQLAYGREKIQSDLDRPTRFTTRGLAVVKATNAKPESALFVKPIQAEYLQRQVYGGTRLPQRRFVFVPAKQQRTNVFGNMPAARRRRALQDSRTFYRSGGRAGQRLVYRRLSRRLEFLGVMVPRTQYRNKPWRFYDHTLTFYRRNFAKTYVKQHAFDLRKLARTA